jgi:hypothetical protein
MIEDSGARTAEVIAAVSHNPEVAQHAYVVGAWIWVEFKSIPSTDARAFLVENGFHWNKTRQVWQHNCGVMRRANRRGDPRYSYGVQRLNTINLDEVA